MFVGFVVSGIRAALTSQVHGGIGKMWAQKKVTECLTTAWRELMLWQQMKI